MKRFLWIGGIVLFVLLAAFAIVPFLVPNDVYRSQIEKSASQALGREVTLSGDVGLSLLPRISASIEGVTIANPDGFSRENMVEAGQLRAVVRWAPLISRRVEVAELIFADADVALERLESGETNWQLGPPSPSQEDGSGAGGGGFDAGIDRASLRNAALSYRDALTGADYALRDLDLTASMRALDAPLRLEAAGVFQEEAFEIDLRLETPQALMSGQPARAGIDFESGLADAGYDGALTLADAPVLDGDFSLDARDLAGLAALAGTDAGIDLARIGRIRAEGRAEGPVAALQLGFSRLDLTGDLVEAGYEGRMTLSQVPVLDGALDLRTSDLAGLLNAFGVSVPGGSALSELEFSGKLSGPADAVSLAGARLRHESDLLEAGFDGAVSLAGAGAIDGELTASSTRLRELLAAFDVALAPGETLRQFRLDASASGTLEAIDLTGLSAQLDDIRATGRAGLDLRGERAKVSANLSTGHVDLSAFLGEGEGDPPADKAAGWSDEPLDLAGLRAVDADLQLEAERVILGDVTLDKADLGATLDGGRLNADIRSAQAFGGAWTGRMGLDASGGMPRMELDVTGEPISLSQTLSVLAGLDALTGTGDLVIDVSSSGASLKALVSGLSGEMSANVADGMVRGINIGRLVRSRENIVRALADGSLQLALSPEAETDFTNLVAGLSLQDGVAELEDFRLDNPVLTLEGSGRIDLGARTLDVGIVPRLDTSGQGQGSAVQLNGVPIPFRIRGDWLAPKLAPDTQMVQNILREDLTSRARDEIRSNIGGDVAGSVLGEILGVPAPKEAPPPAGETEATAPDGSAEAVPAGDAEPAAEPSESAEPADPEDIIRGAAENAARDALGDLFGSGDREDENGGEE